MNDAADINSANTVNVYTRIPADLDQDLEVAVALARTTKPKAIAEAIRSWVRGTKKENRARFEDLDPEERARLKANLAASVGDLQKVIDSLRVQEDLNSSLARDFGPTLGNLTPDQRQALTTAAEMLTRDPHHPETDLLLKSLKSWKNEQLKLKKKEAPHEPRKEAARPRAVNER